MFPRYFEFYQTSTSVSITCGNTEKMFSVLLTRGKLNCGNSPSLSKRKFSILFIMAYAVAYNGVNLIFPCMFSMHAIIETRLLGFSQSKLTFTKCYFIIYIKTILNYLNSILFQSKIV